LGKVPGDPSVGTSHVGCLLVVEALSHDQKRDRLVRPRLERRVRLPFSKTRPTLHALERLAGR